MPKTLGDLKARIIAETNRDDLGAGEALDGTLGTCIDRAIEFYSDETFWFTRDSGPATAIAGTGYIAQPDSVRVPGAVWCNDEPLLKVSASDIEFLASSNSSAAPGVPTRWAPTGDRILLWPIPDTAYSLYVYGTGQIEAPQNDGDTTAWTNEAYDLIAARTRFLLFRDIFRDVEGSQLAAQAEGEALGRLRRETRRRAIVPLRASGDEPWAARGRFSISRAE